VAALTSAPPTPAMHRRPPRAPPSRPALRTHCRAAAAGRSAAPPSGSRPPVAAPPRWQAPPSPSARFERHDRHALGAGIVGIEGDELEFLPERQPPVPARAAAPPMIHRSPRRIAAACPKRKLESPACAAPPRPCTRSAARRPTAKKTLSTMPSAASVFSLVRRVISITVSAASAPVKKAPGRIAAQIARAGDQEAQADAGQGGMAERIAQQALPAQHGEGAQHTGSAQQRRAGQHGAHDAAGTEDLQCAGSWRWQIAHGRARCRGGDHRQLAP
jgi:hypothetical protein